MTHSEAFEGTLTSVPGLRVGHAHNLDAITGCTVILCPPGTVAGVDQRGGAPGTRETDLLRPMRLVQQVNAILLAGGSAFGLAAADGVMRWLEERGLGYPTPAGVVPIVPAAILYDLGVGRADRRPDAAMGYAACQAATEDPVAQGSVGAGTGASVGKLLGMAHAMKGGIGSAAVDLGGGLIVAALMAVNAVGDVIEADGTILAGVRRSPQSDEYVGALRALGQRDQPAPGGDEATPTPSNTATNTVIGVVATSARLDRDGVTHMAQSAHDGLARAVNPAHMRADGDTIFGLATGTVDGGPHLSSALVSAYAAEVTAEAIRNAVRRAVALGGLPALGSPAPS
jgi:L-aminopeptidase/D-esterase-like protein